MDNIKMTFYFILLLSLIIVCCTQSTREQILRNTNKLRKLPGLDICGKTNNVFGTKIINGEPANLGDYPWMANLGYKRRGMEEPRPLRWNCGGSLITDQYVITAAHCLEPTLIRPMELVTVRLGELDLDPRVDDGANPKDYDIEIVIYHPDYNNFRKVNDIGLIKLKEKVVFSDVVRPICTPPPEFDSNRFVGHAPSIAGWGESVLNAPPSTRLLKAEVHIQDTGECRTNVTSVLRNVVIDDKVICASAPGKDACQGDSGGPLMMYRTLKNTSGNIFLLGVVSYGHRCAIEGYPTVFNRVVAYMPWIIDNLDI